MSERIRSLIIGRREGLCAVHDEACWTGFVVWPAAAWGFSVYVRDSETFTTVREEFAFEARPSAWDRVVLLGAPRVASVWSGIETSTPAGAILEAIKPAPVQPGVCPECNGRGYFLFAMSTPTCDACGGTGKV
ncbi:MAG: hypothetical protein VYA51_13005 [Planctomycetota bacterium]|nr:hypothetical protein [Planctomycetota bacterium]